MRKLFFTGLLLLCILLFYACRPDCSDAEITPEEESFISYNMGDEMLFLNDSSGLIDTLICGQKEYMFYCQDCKCRKSHSGIHSSLAFYPYKGRNMYINMSHTSHSSTGGLNTSIGSVTPGTPFQTVTVSSITYTDVYIVSVDSNSVNDFRYPWKMEYSKSKGVIRVYYRNGTVLNRI